MDEIVLQFSAYSGFAKGEAFEEAADIAERKMPQGDLGDWRRQARDTPWDVPPVVPFEQ